MHATYFASLVVVVGRRLAAAALLTFALIGAAAADGLFSQLPGNLAGVAAAQQTPGTGVIRARDVALDPAYLASRIAPAGVDNLADRASMAPAASTVRIELFPGYVVDLNRTSISEAFGGGFVWTGESPNKTGASANLVVRNGRVTGTVDFGKYVYRIDPLAVDDAHRISEVDTNAFPKDIELPVQTPPAGKRSDAGAGFDHVQAITEITILMPYTARAVTSLGQGGDIIAQANLGVSRSNSAYQRSGVEISMRLVGTPLVDGYDEQAAGKTYRLVLDELTNATGSFQAVHTARDTLGADLVALLIDRPEFCGLGWLPTTPSAQTANLGFSVNTVANCILNDVIAHETGHNMGLNHDRFQVSNAPGGTVPPNTEYNFGFVSRAGAFRDIMSYRDECEQAPAIQCQQINNFSNPNVTFNGLATGVPAGANGATDGARRLNETKAGVASYRATPPVTAPVIVAAVTPVARATAVNGTVTAFATILNGGTTTATGCSVAMPAGYPVVFGYSARNVTTGDPENPGVPVDIAPGNTGRSFVIAFKPTSQMSANIPLVFDCANSAPAPTFVGLNTFLLTSISTPPADLLSIAVTATQDGIMNVPLGGIGFAALAAQNIGANANLQARLDVNPIGTTGRTLLATLSMCQTNPTTGQCSTPLAATIDFTAPPNQMVTFTAFVTSNGTAIPFDPANTRLFIHFFQGNTPVGSANVAVRTVAAPSPALASAAAN